MDQIYVAEVSRPAKESVLLFAFPEFRRLILTEFPAENITPLVLELIYPYIDDIGITPNLVIAGLNSGDMPAATFLFHRMFSPQNRMLVERGPLSNKNGSHLDELSEIFIL